MNTDTWWSDAVMRPWQSCSSLTLLSVCLSAFHLFFLCFFSFFLSSLCLCLSERRKMTRSPISFVALRPSAVAPPLGNQGPVRHYPTLPDSPRYLEGDYSPGFLPPPWLSLFLCPLITNLLQNCQYHVTDYSSVFSSIKARLLQN